MHKLIHTTSIMLRTATGLSFGVLMVAVLIQVSTRTFGSGGSPVWTEELTRYALLYVAGFGAALSLWTGDMVNVDIISERLPPKGGWLLRFISTGAVLFFAVILIEPAWRFTKIGLFQTSPSMPFIKMAYIHASVLVLLVLLAIAAAIRMVGMLMGQLDGHAELRPGEEE